MNYVPHPDYVQYRNEWTAVMLFVYSLIGVVVVIPGIINLFR